jgi:hypothetical protein
MDDAQRDEGRTLRILLIAWYFPPSNTIAAVRLGKLAKFLTSAGHDVRVLTARGLPYAQTLTVEIPEQRIYRTDWLDINSLSGRAKNALRRALKRPAKPAVTPGPASIAARKPPRGTSYFGGQASKLYQLLFNIPDKQIGWLPAARKRAMQLINEWRPDAIFASAPPFTALLLGYLLSKATGIPLIVEYRDRWSDDPYYPPPWWRGRLEQWLESKITRHAAAITTVSEPWAETYRARYANRSLSSTMATIQLISRRKLHQPRWADGLSGAFFGFSMPEESIADGEIQVRCLPRSARMRS